MMDKFIEIILNDSKYLIIDAIDINNKRYCLLAHITEDDTNIDDEFDICIYDNNNFYIIEDEYEYNTVKDIFNRHLEEESNRLNTIKLKVINIDGYNYTLEKENKEKIVKNIEIYGDIKIEVNDYIYMLEKTLEEDMLQYGTIVNNKDEIIKITRDNKVFYLQRYYG